MKSPASARTHELRLGKYRDLVIAITLFLILDLGVLVLNFFASTLIETDAARINTASELRMLSQQMTKALLTMKEEMREQVPIQTSWAQLSEASQQFDRNIAKLKQPPGQNAGEHLIGKLFSGDERAQRTAELAEDVEKTWRPVAELIVPVLATPQPAPDIVDAATIKAVARNIKLIGQAGDLSGYLEESATSRARQLRTIQVSAIGLAFLNFLFIVFKFLRRLRDGDARVEMAQRETGRILATVGEGLFLINAEGAISPQFSKSLPALLGTPLNGGENLFDLVGQMGGKELQTDLKSFAEILFAGRVKPVLVGQLNPMRDIELEVPGRGKRILTFEFEPVHEGKSIPEMLITVQDVTERLILARELESAKERARGEFDLVMHMLDQDPGVLTTFVTQARVTSAQINQQLMSVRPTDGAYRSMLESMLRAMHRLKGEAYTLQLDSAGLAAHHFETEVAALQRSTSLRGEHLIPLPLHLKTLIEALDRIDILLVRMQRLAAMGRALPDAAAAVADPLIELGRSLNLLVERIASETDKLATLHFSVESGLLVDAALLGILREVMPQFLRNAVVHGIEETGSRLIAGKPPVGVIHINLSRESDATLALIVRDDGCGLSAVRLRSALLASGRLSDAQLAQMSDLQIIMQIFQPGVTTAEQLTEHAGRGVGLDAVRETLVRANARLRVRTEPGTFTQFEVRFAAARAMAAVPPFSPSGVSA